MLNGNNSFRVSFVTIFINFLIFHNEYGIFKTREIC